MANAMLMNLQSPLGVCNYTTSIRTMKKNDCFAPHWHDYFEFEIILSGRIEHTYNGKKYIAERGSAHLLGFYDFHSITALADTKLINITFDASALDQDIADIITTGNGNGVCHFSNDEIEYIKDRINILNKEDKLNCPLSKTLQKGAITEIIILLLRKTITDGTAKIPPLIQRAVSYMHKHFREELSLQDVSHHLNVTPNHLGAFFKKHMKMKFHTYLNILRLKYACELLSSTNLSIKEIAFASGYTSVEYFLYIFKNHFGETPSNYRKSHKGM